MSNFYYDLLDQYSKLNIPKEHEEISKINKYINYYLADKSNNYISSESVNNKYIISLDIKSAFPTICNALYKHDPEFVNKINSISEKRGKNIFIATSLKGERLRQLNYISKMIVLGTIFDNLCDFVTILEIKKDGVTIITDPDSYYKLTNINTINYNSFTEYVFDHGFKFHIDFYYKYIRSHKTTWILTEDQQLDIKGIFKHQPSEMINISHNFLKTETIDVKHVNNIYSDKMFKYFYTFSLSENLKKYYICDNNKFLLHNKTYGFPNKRIKVNPFNYLQIFLYPVILSSKIDLISES